MQPDANSKKSIENYVAELIDHMQLNHWKLTVDWSTKLGTSTPVLLTLPNGGTRGRLSFGHAFLKLSPETQRDLLAEQLIRCHTVQIDAFIQHAATNSAELLLHTRNLTRSLLTATKSALPTR